jgi:hypothetical protein
MWLEKVPLVTSTTDAIGGCFVAPPTAYRLLPAAYQLNVIHLLHLTGGALGQFGERDIAEHFVA